LPPWQWLSPLRRRQSLQFTAESSNAAEVRFLEGDALSLPLFTGKPRRYRSTASKAYWGMSCLRTQNHELKVELSTMLKNSDALLSFLLICSPVLLLSPLVFLIREVRKRIALRVAALAIVFGSYVILLFVVVPALLAGAIMNVADKPTHEVVLKENQTLAGIRFPKGSKLSVRWADGGPSSLVLSKDTEINGIPAGKGTDVLFGAGDKVGVITTGRAWIYRGISVPAGSSIILGTNGVRMIDLPSAVVLNVEDMVIEGPSVLEFDGDKLRSVVGHYVWRGDHYKSYRIGVDGQIQRVPE
jgi:hypothetical protein